MDLKIRNLMLAALAAVALVARGPVLAEDWPQWMGPKRDNVWREDGVIDRFPDGGPTILWSQKVAGGYAGPAVAEGRVVVSDYVTKDNVKVANFQRNKSSGVERVLCLDEASGKVLWKHEYPATYTISYPAGPRCTPVIEDGRVYTLGAEGMLICFGLDDGKVLWSKDLPAEYKTKTALWGYASHPLIDGDKLICVVGGKGSHCVAFHKQTGEELWRTLDDGAQGQGYSPPVIIQSGGVRQLILSYPNGVASVNPENGKPYWKQAYEATNGSMIMTPIQWKDHLYIAGYSNKDLMLKLAQDKPAAEVVWRDEMRLGLSPVNVQPFLMDDVLYGFDQSGYLYGVEMPSGKRLWRTGQPVSERPAGSATAFLVRQADRFWMFTEKGELVIAKLSPDGFEALDRAQVIEPTNNAFGREVVWSAPAFANRRVYIRNDQKLICIDLAASR